MCSGANVYKRRECSITTIYLDIYFITNFIMDFFLLYTFTWLIGVRSSIIRILSGALVGGGSACIVLCVSMYPAVAFIVHNILTAAVMIFVVLYKRMLLYHKKILYYILIWYFNAFAMGGVFEYVVKDRLSLIDYIRILAALFVLLYILIKRCKLNNLRNSNQKINKIYFEHGNVEVIGFALYDSGNGLYEPISGSKVMVGEYETMFPYLTEGEKKYIRMFPELPMQWDGKTRIRSIPYASIGDDKGHLHL